MLSRAHWISPLSYRIRVQCDKHIQLSCCSIYLPMPTLAAPTGPSTLKAARAQVLQKVSGVSRQETWDRHGEKHQKTQLVFTCKDIIHFSFQDILNWKRKNKVQKVISFTTSNDHFSPLLSAHMRRNALIWDNCEGFFFFSNPNINIYHLLLHFCKKKVSVL